MPVEKETRVIGHLILLHDMSFIANRSSDTKRFVFYLFLLIGFVVSLVTVVVAQLSWKGWVSGIRSILRGEGIFKPESKTSSPELKPILKDLQALIRDLESEHRTKDDSRVTWSAKTLKEILFNELRGDEILVVSNREPYIHDWKEGKVEMRTPASGLVTALEPIMRACSGTWIAHGSGTADKSVVDKHDRVRVPPDKPAYQIRRVWLSEEEENGYYYGFANEGLWPLCHIAHVRPVFRSSDWDNYVRANEKFAAAVVEEAKTEDPVILVQDYHFALLPRMVREKLPRATIITFWHIPWPNPEAFGICPWRHEILAGLLGSSILGFHTRFHCNNFLDTADRFLECRIDRERSTLSYREKLTAVRQYPISIEWPPKWMASMPTVEECRRTVRERHGLSPDMKIGIGVDRLDYTKGILERLSALELFLKTYPSWVGKVCFIQIAAPSRSKIARYQLFQEEVRSLSESINARFGTETYKPIILMTEHHDSVQVYEYFRASEFCLVSSLHDGMNLVAKEFIASRDDERGVLILSMFTGAARELPEAFIVNPYNIDQCAEAIRAALEMSPEEQRERMRAMRGITQEFNVFRWAGRMLIDAGRMRQRNRLHERMQDWEFQEKNVLGL
jgi:trehalose 6-phosphate synthase